MIPLIQPLLSLYVSISACLCVSLSFQPVCDFYVCVRVCVSGSRLGNLLGLRYEQTGQDCGKEKSLQDLTSRFVLGCVAPCWWNTASVFSISNCCYIIESGLAVTCIDNQILFLV